MGTDVQHHVRAAGSGHDQACDHLRRAASPAYGGGGGRTGATHRASASARAACPAATGWHKGGAKCRRNRNPPTDFDLVVIAVVVVVVVVSHRLGYMQSRCLTSRSLGRS